MPLEPAGTCCKMAMGRVYVILPAKVYSYAILCFCRMLAGHIVKSVNINRCRAPSLSQILTFKFIYFLSRFNLVVLTNIERHYSKMSLGYNVFPKA